MGGGLEADLSHGAVAALWRWPSCRWRPVLQVADLRHVPDGTGPSPAPVQRYGLTLSDGAHSQPATLAASLNHLAREGALRRGSVVRLQDFVRDDRRRTIIVNQLQILQTECALIGSLKPYEPTRTSCGFTTRSIRHALRPEPGCEPYRGVQHNHRSYIASEVEGSTNGLSYHDPCRGSSLPGGDTISCVGPLAEPAVWKMVSQIKDEYLGYSDVPDFITVKAFISFVKTERLCSAAYPMVVNGKVCNVKAAGSDDGMWHCKRSGQIFESCEYGTWHLKRCGHSSCSCDCGYGYYRGQGFGSCDCGYSVRIQIQDHTGPTFATVYDKAAKEIFGYTAEELYFMRSEEQGYVQLRDIVLGIEYKQYVLHLKVKANPCSNGHRAECVVLKAEKVKPSAESRCLLGEIDTLLGKGLGQYPEFGGSMPTANSSHAISPGRARYLGSADGFGQQANMYPVIVKTFPLSAFGACGHGSDVDGQGSSATDGFVGRFGGATPAANIAPDVLGVCSARTLPQRVEWSPGKP